MSADYYQHPDLRVLTVLVCHAFLHPVLLQIAEMTENLPIVPGTHSSTASNV